MLMSKVIMDIIELKQSRGLVEKDWTFEKQVDWLQYAIPLGLVVVKYVDGELKGYLEYVRLNDIPTDINNIPLDYDAITNGPVGFISGVVADSVKTILELKEMAMEKNKDKNWFVLVWHNKKNDIWRVFKRRQHEE
jgi:hypothetical protein